MVLPYLLKTTAKSNSLAKEAIVRPYLGLNKGMLMCMPTLIIIPKKRFIYLFFFLILVPRMWGIKQNLKNSFPPEERLKNRNTVACNNATTKSAYKLKLKVLQNLLPQDPIRHKNGRNFL